MRKLVAALSSWQEMQAKVLANGVQVDAEAALVSTAPGRARKLLA